jgi:hypothetical protein
VVQAGSGAAGEGDVVDGLLAVHPGRVQLVLVALDGLRAAETQRPVVGVGGGYVGGADVEVVQAGDLGAVAQVVALDEAFGAGDVVEELDGEAERVDDADGVADTGRAFALPDA